MMIQQLICHAARFCMVASTNWNKIGKNLLRWF